MEGSCAYRPQILMKTNGFLGVSLGLAGSIFFPFAFLTCAFMLRRLVGIHSLALQTELAMRLTSILQSFMAVTCGCYIIYHCYHDFLYARCWLVDIYISFAVPYMVYDVVAMYAAYHTDAEAKQSAIIPKKLTLWPFLKQRRLIVLHHTLVAFVGYPIALFFRNEKGEFFLGCVFLTELSSPFVNLRSILKKVKRADSQVYKVNEALILLVFLFCRILIFPIMFWVYSWDKPFHWIQVPMMIPWHCNLGCVVLGGFQLTWYISFARIFWRRFRAEAVMDTNKNLSNGAALATKLQ